VQLSRCLQATARDMKKKQFGNVTIVFHNLSKCIHTYTYILVPRFQVSKVFPGFYDGYVRCPRFRWFLRFPSFFVSTVFTVSMVSTVPKVSKVSIVSSAQVSGVSMVSELRTTPAQHGARRHQICSSHTAPASNL
jgi:hypothetical protein